jgi:hypothetical protein
VISFVTWFWAAPVGYRSKFEPDHVNVLFRMIDRNFPEPHRNIVVTNERGKYDKTIEVVPDTADFAGVPNPNGTHNPSCYRRLRAFSPDAGAVFGDRFVSFDLDTVIVGDLRPLFDRQDEFIIWGESDFPRTQWFNGSLWMLKAGSRPKVWDDFNPRHSPRIAAKAGKRGSDQGWLSYVLSKDEATWGRQDGVYSFRKHIMPSGGGLPPDARVVAFHGRKDPWGFDAQQIDWVRAAWR